MSIAAFVGDEVSAACYRLCGVDVHIAGSGNALSLIRRACEQASLVLIGNTTAQTLDQPELDALLSGIRPTVLVVPDARGLQGLPDIASRIHRQLGMLE